jgi:hypothetical protein
MKEALQTSPVFALCEPYAPAFFNDRAVVVQAGIVVGLGLVFLGIFFFFLYRWYFKKHASIADQMLEKLDIMRKKKIETMDDIKISYYHLTRIVKWYVAREFLISMESLTDDEAVLVLKKRVSDPQLVETIEQVFQAALGIKYAQYETLYESLHRDITMMYDLVHQRMLAKKIENKHA